MAQFKNEAELAAVVVAYLQELRLEVFQEVGHPWGSIADIVAVDPLGRITIVETKMSLGFSVLTQCLRWTKALAAHRVIAATPRESGHKDWEAASVWFKTTGVGWWRINRPDGRWTSGVSEEVAPRFIRAPRGVGLTRMIEPQEVHKTYCAAGVQSGRRWSPYNQTCDDLRRRVAQNPGISLKDAIGAPGGIGHHYAKDSTARTCLAKWVQLGSVPGVRIEYVGRKIGLFPVEVPASAIPAGDSDEEG